MKAYKVYDIENYEGYQDIVFAETSREAKKMWSTLDGCDGADYINIRVNRLPFLDDMENRSMKEIMYVAILNGWWYEVDGNRYDEENLGEAIEKGIVTPFEALEDEE